jgi:hypothetical protein
MNDFTRLELAAREAEMARENEQLASRAGDPAMQMKCREFARQHWRKAQLLLAEHWPFQPTPFVAGGAAS